ncbi:hypothetical protein FPRO06_09886 [Fusarium proliferatum]|nr:hypothetical protein FPRO06_09886 [Fusarium proliferatum]
MAQYDSCLGCETQELLAMEQHSVPRSYDMNLSHEEDFDEGYMVPDSEVFTGAPYFTPQSTQPFNTNLGFSSVEEGDFLLTDHPFLDVDPLMSIPMTVDDEYILCDSHQSFEMPFASPSCVASASENPSWDFVEPVPVESVWDLSALHPDSCNISDRRNSEPLNGSGASTPKVHSHDEHEESSALLALSLMGSFRYPCPQESCSKTFKRKEHAKRHYTTKHRPRNRRLQCEFCGKDNFTRQDNLNAHRRLHARRPAKNASGVHFVPAALEMLQKVQKPTSYNGKLIRFFS